jgi:hypothetical protein
MEVRDPYLSMGHHKAPKSGAGAAAGKAVTGLKTAQAAAAAAFVHEESESAKQTIKDLQTASEKVKKATDSIKTVDKDPTGLVLKLVNSQITEAMNAIDTVLTDLTTNKDDPDVKAYAKKIGIEPLQLLQNHLAVTRIGLNWGLKFNNLSAMPDPSTVFLKKTLSDLDMDMVALLGYPDNPDSKEVYKVLDTAKQELQAVIKDVDPPIDSISHQVQFVVSWNASASPSWSLVNFKGPSGPSPFASASRSDTHTLSIVMGSPTSATAKINAIQIGNSISNSINATPPRVTVAP